MECWFAARPFVGLHPIVYDNNSNCYLKLNFSAKQIIRKIAYLLIVSAYDAHILQKL